MSLVSKQLKLDDNVALGEKVLFFNEKIVYWQNAIFWQLLTAIIHILPRILWYCYFEEKKPHMKQRINDKLENKNMKTKNLIYQATN